MSFFGKVKDLAALFAAVGLIIGVLCVTKSTHPDTVTALIVGGAAVGGIFGAILGLIRHSKTSASSRR